MQQLWRMTCHITMTSERSLTWHCRPPQGGDTSLVWAQDLDGAYRQFPVRDPTDCFCVLMTPRGPILLQHHAMTFGAVSSVWNFNRAADGIMFLSRRLLATPLGHYVDDFIGVEPSALVQQQLLRVHTPYEGTWTAHERKKGFTTSSPTESFGHQHAHHRGRGDFVAAPRTMRQGQEGHPECIGDQQTDG